MRRKLKARWLQIMSEGKTLFMTEGPTLSRNAVTEAIRANLGIIVVIAIIGAVLSLLSPVFLSPYNLRTVLLEITTNMYIALGMTLVMILGGIDLSVGSIVAMSGTLTVGFMAFNHVPLPIAVVLGLALGGATGSPERADRRLFQVTLLIVTLGMLNVARGVAYVYSGGHSNSNDGSDLYQYRLRLSFGPAAACRLHDRAHRHLRDPTEPPSSARTSTRSEATGSRHGSGCADQAGRDRDLHNLGFPGRFRGSRLSARMFPANLPSGSATNSTRSRLAFWAALRSQEESAGSAGRSSERSSLASSATAWC